ncbi:MAG: hypothetical protein ACI9TY_000385 [Alphaproteobacteria bacterium]|jgi:hypothetical protein
MNEQDEPVVRYLYQIICGNINIHHIKNVKYIINITQRVGRLLLWSFKLTKLLMA